MANMKEVLKKIETPRVPHVARYHDLDALVNRFFSDGNISDLELAVLGKLDRILTAEFRVAYDYFSQMDKSSPLYGKASELIDYLYRCRNLIDAAHDKAKVYNALSETEKKRLVVRSRKSEPEVLDLSQLSKGGILLVKGLLSVKNRVAAQQSFERQEDLPITPKERQAIQIRLDRALEAMSGQTTDTKKMNRILGLRGRIVEGDRSR